MDENDKFLEIAIKEALKGGVFVRPNPMVGCVIVKNGKILASGYHKVFGGPHAEVNAIRKLDSKKLKNSSMYVTLEPCSTYGKTPPCTDLIIKSGIKKVVIGSIDPNPLHRGRGADILRKNKITVEFGSKEIEKKCEDINSYFFKNMKEKMPYVVLKLAGSLDGKIANGKYLSKWISSEKSRLYAHKLRAESDLIIVGSNTVLKDNPYLNVRDIKTRKQPSVCVIDLKLKTCQKSNIFSIKDRKVFVISDKTKDLGKNVEFIKPIFKNNELDLKKILKRFYDSGVRTVLVEGGGITVANFVKQNLFDKIYWFVSPIIIGADGISSIGLPLELKNGEIGMRLKIKKVSKLDCDILMELER